jgi:hypothetical protein
VFAVAADHAVTAVPVPTFSLDDVAGLADALIAAGGSTLRREPA